MKQIVAIACLTALMILATPFFRIDLAEAELSGLIRGRVINQSLSQKGVEDLEATLYQIFKDKASELALSTANNLFKWGIIGLVALVFGTAFTFKFMRGKKYQQNKEEQKAAEPERISDSMDLIAERLKVLQAIAKLDDRQDLGSLNPQELNRKRRVLKQRAVEITKILQSRDE
jgi:hypothetical protein